MHSKRNSFPVVFLSLLIMSYGLAVVIIAAPGMVSAQTELPGGFKNGAFVDKIAYNIIEGNDAQVLALQNDEIDLIGEMVDPQFLSTLTESEDIDVANVLRNGYGYVTINTAKYPLNITSFRRALAFALDKEAISDEVWDGLSVPQDSCVPQVNPFSIEGQLPYTYYEANTALGNQLLDDAGFLDIDSDGFREAPDGSNFDILIEAAQSSNIALEVGQLVADALQALSVDAVSQPTDFYEYLSRLDYHGDYDIAFLGSSFSDFDVDWLAYEFWSENADEPYYNYPNFRNASYDSWRDQLLHATTYDDVYEAAIEMQKIWVYESPMIICYENILLSAYRNDRFDGFVNDVSDGVPGYWTNYRVHLKDDLGGPFGGTFRWSNPLDIDSFNFMVTSSDSTMNVLQMLYDSLIVQNAEGENVPWLAKSHKVEYHDDNPNVPEGYVRLTFELIQNATWSDGTPLTAEDVAFSFNYYRDSSGNPYGTDLTEMTAAYAPDTHTAIVEFNNESYWYLHTIGYKPIIPKHIYQDIGLEGWNTYDPVGTELVTSGPYYVSDYVAGEFIELSRNSDFFYYDSENNPNTVVPSIESQSDLKVLHGSTGNVIEWPVSDDNPDSYTVFKDGTSYQSGSWSADTISVNIDGLSLGTYNFTLEIEDQDGYKAKDEVIVEVVESIPPSLPSNKIIFDYSHGQLNPGITDIDNNLEQNLTQLGYEVIWARGGINESILSDAGGLILGSIYGEENGYTSTEFAAIEQWFMQGHRLLWVAMDSDYGGYDYINDNMTAILKSVGSHVYGEPTSIEDAQSNAGAGYRVIANVTSDDPSYSEIVEGVTGVLMHGPTCLYGSTKADPVTGVVSLEQQSITDVHPLLYYSPAAKIVDGGSTQPKAHSDLESGSFVASAMELNAGLKGTGVIITSGASPYGSYRPMCTDEYYDAVLNGYRFVSQAIDFGMNEAATMEDTTAPTIDHPSDVSYYEGETGHSITWNVQDDYLQTFAVYRNSTLLMKGEFNSTSESLTVNIDGLEAGSYNYSIIVGDLSDNKNSDSVLVEVLSSTEQSTDTTGSPDEFDILPLSMIITIGSLAIIVIVIVQFARAKK